MSDLVNTDALAEATYISGNPEFYEGEDEPETTLSEDLEALQGLIDECMGKIASIKETHRTRRLNGVERLISEALDIVTDLYERGV